MDQDTGVKLDRIQNVWKWIEINQKEFQVFSTFEWVSKTVSVQICRFKNAAHPYTFFPYSSANWKENLKGERANNF